MLTTTHSSAVWFKIKEGGREGTSNTWADVILPAPSSQNKPFAPRYFKLTALPTYRRP